MTTPAPVHLDPAELRTLFLFTDLSDEQLAWVAEHADVVEESAGDDVVVEGEPSRCFYVLLSGTIAMSRLIAGDPVETTRTEQRGAYFGATQFFLNDESALTYPASVRAITDCALLALPAADFAVEFGQWFPMAVHLLEGMVLGTRRGNSQVAERERLLAIGKLSAGLTHELNNPAAAAVRAADTLRDKVAGMRSKLAMIADGKIAGDQLRKLVMAQDEFVKKVRNAPTLTPLQASDREDEIGDWLDDRGIAGGWDLAPVFVAGGLGVEDLEAVETAACGDGAGAPLEGAVRWLAYTVETESLIREIMDATSRISDLVTAAKQYSQMDRAPFRWTDLHEGLDATLVMFGRKLGDDSGVRIVREYDRSLPRVPAYPAELNQVWTNIVDNAVDAMDGRGTLTVRTALDTSGLDARALIEFRDTGPGIPEDVRRRIFEPFFTTKPVGKGTGLGLDVSYRVIVSRHHGDIRVESQPGDTSFQVLLPLTEEPRLMMPDPLAAVAARFAASSRTAVELEVGKDPVVVDATDPGRPGPLHLIVGAHAADVAAAARIHLERDGDPGTVEVLVTLDEGAPPLLYRRVLLPVHLRTGDAARLAQALDHTETTRLLRPAFTIRTVVEFDGEALY